MGTPTARNVAPAGSEYAETVRSNHCKTVDLARQINREEERDDVQKLLDFHNQDLSSDELIEMQDQQHDIEELES
ncbi:hypothetical protein TNCV_4522851 [Trichonephila clavipes]|nr:hypothetical protein TNCV_4522851 [Trichonephila clavipes]